MSKEGIVYLLMFLNVNRYANVVLERSLRANEGRIGIKESILTILKQIWTQMNGYFLEMNSKRCKSQAIFPLNWVLENFELSLKHVGSQARVGVLYSERSDYNLVERH